MQDFVILIYAQEQIAFLLLLVQCIFCESGFQGSLDNANKLSHISFKHNWNRI